MFNIFWLVALQCVNSRLIMMKRTSTVYLIFLSVFCSFTLGSSDFYLITLTKNYKQAKMYCRTMYTDLATIYNSADMDNLTTLVSNMSGSAWIGLEIGAVWRWQWSLPDQETDFFNWNSGQQLQNSKEECAAKDQQGGWFVSNCEMQRKFICRGNDNTGDFIFVNETKSWRDAQSHCRGLASDLVSIHSEEENVAVHNVSASQIVWIGLFKDPWIWSDGSNSSFRFWRASQPTYLQNQDCIAAVFQDEARWNDQKCNTQLSFVCRKAGKSFPVPIVQGSTQQLLTAVSLTTPAPINFTAGAATNQSNNTNVTTTAGITAPNTTDFLSLTSTTELSSATTNMSSMTQPPPATTVNTTIGGVSTLTALIGTSAQNTTQSSTVTPNAISQDLHPEENTILIQEKMTWIEALSYCRMHHFDLVGITTEHIQAKVAEKARNATSSYVWLGLCYTCQFNFWFWTRSTFSCYQNWLPGQGPGRDYACAVSGAIEATGRQQWVGLPETEKLNFICSTCAG